LILLFNLLVQSFFVSPFQTILPKFCLRFWWSVLLMFYFFCFLSLLFFSYCHYNTILLFVNTFLKIFLNFLTFCTLYCRQVISQLLFGSFFILPLLLLQDFSAYLHQILCPMTHSMPTVVMLLLMEIP